MAESTQHKLDRVRPPRVQITYDVEIGNAIEKKELPLVVGILADLSGKPDTPPAKLVERRFVDIDRDNFNEILSSISPRATLQVDNTISGDDSKLNVELRFNHIEDFDPVNLVKQVVPLRRLFEARQRLRDLLTKLDGNDDLDQLLQDVVANTEGLQEIKAARPEAEAAPAGDSEPRPTSRPDPLPGEAAMPKSSAAEQSGESSTQTLSLLDEIIAKGRMAHDDSQQDYARDMLAEFATQVLDEGMAVDKDTVAMINDRISQIDALISDQLNQIIHHPELQKLEASWRGLHQLVSNTETSARLKLRLLNVGKNELQNDLEKAVEFDQSALFKKIYEEEYGTFGGHPFSLLIGDFTFGRHPQDIGLLEKLSNVAAAAHAPFIAAASPRLFDMNSFTELAVPRDLTKIFESLELIKWRAFRESEDSRYVSLVLPNFLLRLPYGPETRPVEGMNYVEDVNGTDHSKYLWGNAAWVLAQRITEAFAKYGWCAAIRGAEGGGAVEGLPAHTFRTSSGDLSLKCPTEVAITDRREKELNDLGFISLCHKKNSDVAVFFGGQTTNKARLYNTNEANANARLSAMLPYVLAASRFAHYLKVIMRDKVGSFMTRDNVQTYLNNWIADYVLINDNAPQEIKAQYPLREARVDVSEVAGKPGAYRATVFLRPHFQLEELSASIRLVANLPPPVAA
ncbi:type VI secretion system contractile sheath large subunit [Pseudomonas aeruginosa PA99]|nr:type VI secretion system contractile sheath large subunit [Pseudomonas aeruginosa PA99]